MADADISIKDVKRMIQYLQTDTDDTPNPLVLENARLKEQLKATQLELWRVRTMQDKKINILSI